MDRKSHFERTYWSRLVLLLLGIWLICSPSTFGYEVPINASVTGIGLKERGAIQEALFHLKISDIVTGLLVIILGLISLKPLRQWPCWLIALLGLWLQFAPLAFWAPKAVIYINDTLVGMFLIVFSLLVTKLPYEGWSSNRVIPAGWSYNPSAWLQRLPVIFFGFLGWFISRYLSAYQLGYISTVWDPFFGDGTFQVITSKLSQSFPVSDAGMGALAYGLEALMGCKGGPGRWRTMPWMVALFGLLVVPLGLVSILLVMSQPIVVGAWCGLCLITAVGMLIMLSLTVDEVLAVCQFLKTTDKPFWQAFFQGGEQVGALEDTRTPSITEGKGRFKAMVFGVTIPWNLLVTALLGIGLLFSPAFLEATGKASDNSHIFGALITVFSIVAWAEVTRSLRYINIAIALWLMASQWLLEGVNERNLLYTVITALLLIIFSVRKGPIRETYGSWKIF